MTPAPLIAEIRRTHTSELTRWRIDAPGYIADTLAFHRTQVEALVAAGVQYAIWWDLDAPEAGDYGMGIASLPLRNPVLNSIADRIFAGYAAAGIALGVTIRPHFRAMDNSAGYTFPTGPQWSHLRGVWAGYLRDQVAYVERRWPAPHRRINYGDSFDVSDAGLALALVAGNNNPLLMVEMQWGADPRYATASSELLLRFDASQLDEAGKAMGYQIPDWAAGKRATPVLWTGNLTLEEGQRPDAARAMAARGIGISTHPFQAGELRKALDRAAAGESL